MKHALPLLIERAQAARDQQAARTRQARQSATQAQATLQRLQAFRGECLARSPAAVGGSADGASLAGYQQFVTRLDEAIGMQGQEAGLRERMADEQQRQLLQHQQRLLAFQTLARRQAQQQAHREQRLDQRTSDEFAARAAAAHQQDPQP